jgi:transcriptional regulator with XRE-family HTH domain
MLHEDTLHLREFRTLLNYSQEELAKMLHCHRQTLMRWELGYRKPRPRFRRAILRLMLGLEKKANRKYLGTL